MLDIKINDDLTVTITSDDKQAENMRVADALRGMSEDAYDDTEGDYDIAEEHRPDLADAWMGAPLTGDLLVYTFAKGQDAQDALEALIDLTGSGDEQYARYRDLIGNTHQGGSPKPQR